MSSSHLNYNLQILPHVKSYSLYLKWALIKFLLPFVLHDTYMEITNIIIKNIIPTSSILFIYKQVVTEKYYNYSYHTQHNNLALVGNFVTGTNFAL
jgi:hypothetical protein